jgi:cell division transport system permease protein
VGTIIGITLVLFMLGVFGTLMLNAHQVSTYLKENIKVQLFLKPDLKEAEIMQFRKELDTSPFTKSTIYVTAEEAAEQLTEDLGEDFLEVLGTNPLSPSVELNISSDHASPDSLDWVVDHLQKDVRVQEVAYNKVVVENIDKNLRRLGVILLAFSFILLMIAVLLINNTIRLAIYSKRFLIRTMHLVGATQWFIKRPFLGQSLMQGLVSAILAIGLLVMCYRVLLRYQPEMADLTDMKMFAMVFGGITIIGLLISLISTWFAVRKYIRMNVEELH